MRPAIKSVRWSFLIATLCFPLPARAASAFSSALAEMGLNFKGAPPYELQTDRRWGQWPQANSQWTVTTASGTPKLRLQAYAEISSAAAKSKEDLQLRRLLFLYTGDSAYPGMESRPEATPPQLLPEILSAGPSGRGAAIVSATGALTYGNAKETLSVYRGVLTFLYCPSARRFFQVELFYPKDGFKKEIALRDARRFSCAP